MKIKTSSKSEKRIQDNVFIMDIGIISNGKVYNTISYYIIPEYELRTIIKEIKRC